MRSRAWSATPARSSALSRIATSELAGAITGSQQTFAAIADSDQALEDTIQILPTFQRETRATLTRLDQFQANTRPLVRKLLPVANDISPTLRSVRQLSPNLEELFNNLDPLIKAGKRGLPALTRSSSGPRACDRCSTRSTRSSRT